MKQAELFEGSAPYSNQTTSRAAAKAVEKDGKALSQRERIYNELMARGPLACWQVEEIFGLTHQGASARLNELVMKGAAVQLKDDKIMNPHTRKMQEKVRGVPVGEWKAIDEATKREIIAALAHALAGFMRRVELRDTEEWAIAQNAMRLAKWEVP